MDEAGRGPLAGPVVAGAVILCTTPPEGLDDSKRLTAKRRAALDSAIRDSCAWSVGIADVAEIDRVNILVATLTAMTRAVAGLMSHLPERQFDILIDGTMTPHSRVPEWTWPAAAIVGGDSSQPAISAASIVAKEWRDRLMREAALAHPHYGWARNKGYGTAEHRAALAEHGPTPLHRRSFAPLSQMRLL